MCHLYHSYDKRFRYTQECPFGKNRGGSWYTIYHHLSSFTCSRAKPEETPLFSSTNQWEFGTSQAILLSHQETAPQRLSPHVRRRATLPRGNWSSGRWTVGFQLDISIGWVYCWICVGKIREKHRKVFLRPFNKLTKHYDRWPMAHLVWWVTYQCEFTRSEPNNENTQVF